MREFDFIVFQKVLAQGDPNDKHRFRKPQILDNSSKLAYMCVLDVIFKAYVSSYNASKYSSSELIIDD